MRMTRRVLLGLGLGLTGGGAFAVDAWSRRQGGVGVIGFGRAFFEPGMMGAEKIGRAWLVEHPEEADPAILVRLLTPLPEAAHGARPLTHPAVREWLDKNQREDFESDRIVKLHGWWLSQTEARFCALLFLA